MKVWNGLLSACLCTASCSNVGKVQDGEPRFATAVALSSVNMHEAYNNFLAKGGLAAIRRVAVDKLYQDALATSTDAVYSIADLGLRWDNVHQTLLAEKGGFEALSARFPTVGDLIDAEIMTGGSETSLSQFQAVFKGLNPNLSLVDTGHIQCPASTQDSSGLQTVPNIVTYQHGSATYQPPFKAGETTVYVYPNQGQPAAVKPVANTGFITVNGRTSARRGDTSSLEALMAHPGLEQLGSLGQQVGISSQCPKLSTSGSGGLDPYVPTGDSVENSLTTPLLYSAE